MTKKRRPARKKKRSRRTDVRKMAMRLDNAQEALLAGRYEDAIKFSQAVLAIAPQRSRQRVEALAFLANAMILLNRFDEGHDALSLAVQLDPDDPYLWYNWHLTAFYTGRSAEALLSLRRAIELEGDGDEAASFLEQLAALEEIVDDDLRQCGPEFTFEQLLGQQALYYDARILSKNEDWPNAEKYFRQVIQMSDRLAPPWENLGICLLMQRRYDEAEAAFSRALEIDPTNEQVRQDLETLAKAREIGELPPMGIVPPFPDVEVIADFRLEDE